MSLPWGYSAEIAVLAPVSTLDEATASVAAGAGLVDVGHDDALLRVIRIAIPDMRICGYGEGADIVRDARLAARSEAGLICDAPDLAAAAVRSGIAAARVLVRTAPGHVEATSRSGWATLVDLDSEAGALARMEAVATVCVWLGVKVIRTRHITEIRRCLDMTESILGRRPPTWTLRGLA